MSREFRKQLVDYYAEQSPDPRVVDRLVRLSEVDSGRSDGPAPPVIRAALVRSRLAIAATVIAALGAGWLLGASQSRMPTSMVSSQELGDALAGADPEEIQGPLEIPLADNDPRLTSPDSRHPGVCCLMSPRLVAVMLRKENCPRCVAVSPEFARLSTKYVDEPVMFVALDVTDAQCLEESRELAAKMGFKELFESPVESGTVQLIDRQSGRLIASCKQPDKLPDWEQALASQLPHDRGRLDLSPPFAP